jgi:adenylate cyclase
VLGFRSLRATWIAGFGLVIDPILFQRSGLYDPAAANASDRLALLRWLEERGLTLEEMVDAHARGRITGILGDRALRPGERLDARELAARCGVSIERVEQLRRAVGLGAVPREARVYTEGDVRLVHDFEAGVALYGEATASRLLRAAGSSFSRLADAAVSLFLVDVEEPLMRGRRSELELAQANLAACELAQRAQGFIDGIFRVHVEDAIRRSSRARQAACSYDTWRLAVGFVDLVGFTPLALQLPGRELAALIDDFEARGFDVAARYDGRVVKLIGDEVMFVAPTAAAGCDIALTLAESLRDRQDVTPRGGVAIGDLLARGGDYYGPVVNLASRIADLAVPHEVLVTAEVRQEVEGTTLAFPAAGRRMLKGFTEPVELFAAVRA